MQRTPSLKRHRHEGLYQTNTGTGTDWIFFCNFFPDSLHSALGAARTRLSFNRNHIKTYIDSYNLGPVAHVSISRFNLLSLPSSSNQVILCMDMVHATWPQRPSSVRCPNIAITTFLKPQYASAEARYDKVQGGLTLGGYDTSRFGSKNVTFNFYNDVSQTFLADLRTITYIPTAVSTVTTSTNLMSETLSMYIDSTIPYTYLPVDICDKFESAFGLVWNATNELYTVNETAHATLLSDNPSITFTLATSFPVLSNGTNSSTYFPLKRATNDTQFTLGRVFLQEAYPIADYDRSQSTVAPCVWPSAFTENIVAIHPPSPNSTNNTITITHKSSISSSTPIGAIVRGVVGGIVLIIAAILAYWWFIYKPKHKNHVEPEGSSAPRTELSTHEEAEKKRRAKAEIAGTPILGHETDSQAGIGNEAGDTQVFEMPAREPVGSELHTPQGSPRQSLRFSEGLVSPRSQSGGTRSPLSVSSRDSSRGPSGGDFAAMQFAYTAIYVREEEFLERKNSPEKFPMYEMLKFEVVRDSGADASDPKSSRLVFC
ncbi:hypothetical protein BDZ45DRAFT_803431 [Acephala macrosclerotiorum]|nr:hypothetical protein BDZ45DRAFT_803431 [Acephala macrosclerotiorum]